MGYRIFRDSAGREWQTWDVVPRLGERRVRDRRMRALPPPREERRRAVDRRIVSGRRPLLSAGLDNGWLCFETEVEKRRLAPIPVDWVNCAADRLEEYCRAARPAVRAASLDTLRKRHE